jgi:drug/metabolite transporter (DMT)-like permease
MTQPAHTRSDSVGGLLRIAAAAVVWGTIPLVLRAADGASAVKVFYRVVIAGVAMLLWMAARGRLGELRSLSRRKLLSVAGQGALLAVNWLLFLTALDMTKVAVAELLGYTGPVFVAALAPFVNKEAFDKRIVLPLALALGGILVILAPQGITLDSGRETIGAVLAFCSALTYAALLLRSKRIIKDISSPALMVVEYGVASVLLLPALLFLPGPSTPLAFGALLTLGLVQTAASGLLFLSGLRRVRTDHAAIIMYGEPVSAVLFAAAFLGEALTWPTLLGGAMVVGGGALVARLDAGYGPEAPPTNDDADGVEATSVPADTPGPPSLG